MFLKLNQIGAKLHCSYHKDHGHKIENYKTLKQFLVSPFHQKLKFPSPKGVVAFRGKQENARYCFNLVVRGSLFEKPNPLQTNQVVAVFKEQNVAVKSVSK